MPTLRFYVENHCYHLTTTTHERAPIFLQAEYAATVVDALQFLRVHHALLLAYAVMPDHAHVLLVPRRGWDVSRIMQTVKGYTARLINQRRGTRGPLWQRSFYDRVIRDDRQLVEAINYVHQNPVAAGLADTPEAYPFSSAGKDHLVDVLDF